MNCHLDSSSDEVYFLNMSMYEVLFWTPKTDHSTDHSMTRKVEAESIPDAFTKIVEEIVESEHGITLVGFDTIDSFGGIDRDHYRPGNDRAKFREEIEGLIHTIKKVTP